MQKWYVVYVGRVPGVYTEWSECHAQVNKFSGNEYKGFKSKEEAEASYLMFMRANGSRNAMKNFIILVLLIVIAFLLYVIIV
jgi:viroplasmin and RNaseH domain-containing protein